MTPLAELMTALLEAGHHMPGEDAPLEEIAGAADQLMARRRLAFAEIRRALEAGEPIDAQSRTLASQLAAQDRALEARLQHVRERCAQQLDSLRKVREAFTDPQTGPTARIRA